MDDTKKMFQTIINGQSSIKSELLGEISKLRKETSKGFEDLNGRLDHVEKNLTGRIDKIGLQVAKLEDDAPTIKEHDELKERVEKLEQSIATA